MALDEVRNFLKRRRIAAHIRGRVADAVIHEDPWPHLIIDDLLPVDFYVELLESWPSDSYFRQFGNFIGAAESDDHAPGIRQVYLSRNSKPFLSDRYRALPSGWRTLRVLFDRVLLPEAAKALRPYAPLYLDSISADARTKFDLCVGSDFLQCFQHNAVFGPHVDSLHQAANAILYMPLDGSGAKFGTTLYTSSGSTGAHSLRKQLETGGFDSTLYPRDFGGSAAPVKTVAFIPNRLLLILNGPGAWHSVAVEETAYRRSYNVFCMLPGMTRNFYRQCVGDVVPEKVPGYPVIR